jgi:ankyrin repeat protein
MDDIRCAQEIRTAIKQGDLDTLQVLIGSDKTILELMTVFGTWLHVATAHEKLEILKYLVSIGADVNRKGGILGGGPLNEAASKGNLEIVKYLVSCGAELDVSEPNWNPLFGAIHGGHTSVAKFLIESGIDITVRYTGENMKNMDALAFAKESGRSDIVRLLSPSGVE